MRLRTTVAVATMLGIAGGATPATAAPDNQNSQVRTFICDGSALEGVTIRNNNARSFQVISGADGRVFHVTKVIRDGAVLFAVPGWEGRTDVTCTDPSDPAVTGYGFFAPRS